MTMLLRLAWRNIWRNKRRSLIIILSVVVGLAAVVLYDTLSLGMMHQMLENQIGAHVSHMQVHKHGFSDNKIVQNYLPESEAVLNTISDDESVAHFSRRVISFGMLSSATSSSGMILVGIAPGEERTITDIAESVVEGQYLSSGSQGGILMGAELAKKLEVGLGDKVVAMASALSGEIGSDVFRVVGIYQSFNKEFDKVHVYVTLEAAQQLLQLNDKISEIALIAHDLDEIPQIQSRLQAHLNPQMLAHDSVNVAYEIQTYQELLPMLVWQLDMYKNTVVIFYGIIALAMIFGIVNTMLMSVFERIREFGVLMSLGMKNVRLFAMVILEALLLGIVGTVAGSIFGFVIFLYFSANGLDLSNFSDGLNSFGAASMIYPRVTFESALGTILIVPIASVLGAVFPAISAMLLQPIDAVRHH